MWRAEKSKQHPKSAKPHVRSQSTHKGLPTNNVNGLPRSYAVKLQQSRHEVVPLRTSHRPLTFNTHQARQPRSCYHPAVYGVLIHYEIGIENLSISQVFCNCHLLTCAGLIGFRSCGVVWSEHSGLQCTVPYGTLLTYLTLCLGPRILSSIFQYLVDFGQQETLSREP